MYLRLFILTYLIAFSSHALEAKNKRVLNLSSMGITDVSTLEIPKLIKTLKLGFNNITSLEGLSLPVNLRKLSLISNNLKSLEGFFPNNKLNYLSLSLNPNIDLNTLPDLPSLKTLFISSNELNNNNFNLITAPNSIEILSIIANLYEEFDLSSKTNITSLYMNDMFDIEYGGDGRDMDYSQYIFPPNLEELRVGNVTRSDNFTTLTLPQTLKKLNLFAAFLTDEEFQTLTLSPNLQVINLKLNRLTTLDGIEFPDTIRKLNLQKNSFSSAEKRKIKKRFGKKVKIKF